MSCSLFMRVLTRKSLAGGAAGLLAAGALIAGTFLTASVAHAADDQPVAVETAMAVEVEPGTSGEVEPGTSGTTCLQGTTVAPDSTACPLESPQVPTEPDVVLADEPIGIASATVAVASDAGTALMLGQKITYTSTVTNDGNVVLSALALTETVGTGTACNTTTLAAGASATCTSSHVVTQNDLDRYFVQNIVSGTAVSPAGDTVTLAPGSVIDDAPMAPAATLSFVSDADGDVVYGQKVTYTITMTNTGDVDLFLVQHFWQSLSAETVCNGQVLQVGGSLTCTSVHWITDVDVAAGSISNEIYVSLTGPTGSGALSLRSATLTNKVLASTVAEVVPVAVPSAQGNLVEVQALAATGSKGVAPILVGAGAFLLVGAGAATVRRRQKGSRA